MADGRADGKFRLANFPSLASLISHFDLVRLELINTGTELLLGNTVNTHLSYLGQKLFPLGLRLQRQICVPDGAAIKDVLKEAFPRADILLVTGGLGPTNDDITRELTAELLGLPLELNEVVAEEIRAYMAKRGKGFSDSNRRQAMVPRGALVLPNPNGTAPGLYLPKAEHPHIFLLPGPPRELYPMFENEVAPRLRGLLTQVPPACREWKFYGIGESELADRLEPLIEKIPGVEEIGYCAKSAEIHLRCVGSDAALDQVENLARNVYPNHLIGDGERELEHLVVELLAECGQRVCLAESCTGGLIAHRLTNISGASAVLDAAFVTYANSAKERLLGVDSETLRTQGAVSEAVARMMAEGCLRQSGADHALAATGIAGPMGGTEAKPVGTVYLAIASKNADTYVERAFFPVDRSTFKLRASQRALDLLRRRLLGLPWD